MNAKSEAKLAQSARQLSPLDQQIEANVLPSGSFCFDDVGLRRNMLHRAAGAMAIQTKMTALDQSLIMVAEIALTRA